MLRRMNSAIGTFAFNSGARDAVLTVPERIPNPGMSVIGMSGAPFLWGYWHSPFPTTTPLSSVARSLAGRIEAHIPFT